MAEKGMSSKVMDMKFMRQAEMKAEEKAQEEEQKKLQDLSEWKSSAAESLKAKFLAQKRQVRTVGFQTLRQLRNGTDGAIVGRRTFGEEPKKEEVKDEKPKGKNDDDDLDELWKRTQLSGNQGKRSTSGSKRPHSEDGSKKHPKKRKSQS